MNDHRVMEQLFERVKAGESGLLDGIAARLEAHRRAEEDHVYPAVVRDDPKEVFHGHEEHHEAAAMLYKAKQADPAGPDVDSAVREFIDAVTHHVEEESEILPSLRESVGADRMEEMSREFERRRLSELKADGIADGAKDGLPAGSGGPDRVGRVPVEVCGPGRSGGWSRVGVPYRVLHVLGRNTLGAGGGGERVRQRV